eukprot:gene959-biopygen4777
MQEDSFSSQLLWCLENEFGDLGIRNSGITKTRREVCEATMRWHTMQLQMRSAQRDSGGGARPRAWRGVPIHIPAGALYAEMTRLGARNTAEGNSATAETAAGRLIGDHRRGRSAAGARRRCPVCGPSAVPSPAPLAPGCRPVLRSQPPGAFGACWAEARVRV